MKLVLVAPGVHPPLTEGRKLFVTELADSLRQRGVDVDVVKGGERSSGFSAILQSVRELRQICNDSRSLDAVFVFPFGTYTGLRRHVNGFLLQRAQKICNAAKVFMRPVFYSCAGLDFDQLSKCFKPALAVGRSGEGVKGICLGTLRHMPKWSPIQRDLQTVLFLCGYQKATSGELNSVLYQRGLIDVLKAGNPIAEAGIRLKIAIPFLRHAAMRGRILRLAAHLCPLLKIEMLGDGSPIDLLMASDAFLFPYRGNHAVFVPTSLLEALQIGVPTLAADQESYRVLTHAGSSERCRLHRTGDSIDMVNQLLRMKREYPSVVSQASETATRVREDWTISRSIDDMLSVVPLFK